MLAIHPFAELIPAASADDSAAIERDIKAHGQREPIVLFNGQILDGRHRYAACVRLGVEPKTVEFTGADDEAEALVYSLNVHRRHLTNKQKLAIVAAELKRDVTQSSRAIAAKAKVTPNTVIRARANAEAAGTVCKMNTIIGKDGIAQPAKKASKKTTTDSAPADTPTVSEKTPREERIARVTNLVAQGMSVKQIAAAETISTGLVNRLIKERGIDRPKVNKARAADPDRIVRQVVEQMVGSVAALVIPSAVNVTISAAEADALLTDAKAAMKIMQKIISVLKEKTNG